MTKSRLLHLLLCLTLVFTLVGGVLATQSVALAQEGTSAPSPTPAPPPSLTLDSKYPSLSADSGQFYTFDVDIKYSGSDRKAFALDVTAPQGWSAYTTAGYPEREVTSVQMGPSEVGATEAVKVNLMPNYGTLPDPGDYIVTLKVSSGTLSQSIDLKSTVKAKYTLDMNTDTGNLNTKVTAGKENHFTFNLVNAGSAAIDSLSFNATKPDGWTVSFKPEKVDSLSSGQSQQIDVVINPPEGKTIAGDYMINLKADNGKQSSAMDVRVTVLTPSIWGWVGIIIIVVVIAGLAVLFMKLGRR